MFRKYLSLALATLLLHIMIAGIPVSIHAQSPQDARLAAKAKTDVAALGVGEEARVVVKLRDGRKLKGYISQAGEDSFVVTDAKGKLETTIAYTEVLQVKRKKGISTGKAIAIGAGLLYGVGLLITLAIGDRGIHR